MRDDDRSGAAKRFVSTDVITVVMGVDYEADGLFAHFSDVGQKLIGQWFYLIIDNEYAIFP